MTTEELLQKATPRPWSGRDYKTKSETIWIDCNTFANKGKGKLLGGTVCGVYDQDSDSLQRANVELIVRAVNSFAAARDALRKLVVARDESERDDPPSEELWREARAALALMEGNQ